MYTKRETVKISDLRKHTAEVIEEIGQLDHPVTVFSHSEPRIIMASYQWFKANKQLGERPQPTKAHKKKTEERHGLDFFVNLPEEFLMKGKGLDAVKMIRAERD